MRDSAAKVYRSRAMKIAVPVILLLGCIAGWLGYCYVGPISIEKEDLLSATLSVLNGDERTIDLTDPATREEIARLLNGLHRWYGTEIESPYIVSLEVKLRDGLIYLVGLYPNDSLKLCVDEGRPGQDTCMWVKSEGMTRFLKNYYYLEP